MNDKYKIVAIKAAKEAGKIILDFYNKSYRIKLTKTKEVRLKPDIESGKIIFQIINKEFPYHTIQLQKAGSQDTTINKKSDYLWVIDSLDGVGNYYRHLPVYSISIGLLYKREPILGVIYAPQFNILLTAEKGKGAYLNKKIKIFTSQRTLTQSFLYIPGAWNGKKELLNYIKNFSSKIQMMRILDSSAFSFAQVAMGDAEATIHQTSRLHDVAAGVIIVREAGGKVTDFEGHGWNIKSKNIIASNSIINKDLIRLLNKK